MNLRILTAASRDLVKGKKFYERQEEGLGGYFLDTLYSDIDSLILYAGIHRKIRGYHCMFSKRFPYAVYYKTESNEIRVYRVMDCRQDPRKTLKALTERE
jgi:plasmid stabilization system protein ParE